MLGASGTSIIDVSGKDELDLFFRLCNKLKIDAQFVADLDLVVHGKLRQSVSHDERCKAHLQAEGMGEDLMTPLGQMERQIDECLKVTEPASSSAPSTDPDLRTFFDVLGDATKIEEKRYVFLLALRHLRPQIEALMPEKLGTINFINGRLMKLVGAFERCGVHLLPNGELENHLLSYSANPFKVTDKAKQVAFKEERDLLLSSGLTEEQIKVRYAQLITVLDKASRSTIVNMDKYLSYTISDWIHNVQSAFRRGEIVDLESLRRNALVQWSVYSRIMEVTQFSATATGFTCTAKLKPLVDQDEREVAFDSNTVPAGYELTNTDR